jgi:hypothetical protein
MTKSSNPGEPGRGLLPSPGPVLQVDVVARAFGVAVMHGWVADNPPVLETCLPPSRSEGKLLLKRLQVLPGSMFRRAAAPLNETLRDHALPTLAHAMLQNLN